MFAMSTHVTQKTGGPPCELEQSYTSSCHSQTFTPKFFLFIFLNHLALLPNRYFSHDSGEWFGLKFVGRLSSHTTRSEVPYGENINNNIGLNITEITDQRLLVMEYLVDIVRCKTSKLN